MDIRIHSSALLACVMLASCAMLRSPPPPEGPPDTDIFLGDISTIGESLWVGKMHPIAVDDGYENQPAFTEDGRALIYAAAGPGGKTDVWIRTLSNGETRQLTQTAEKSEYSPRLSPDQSTLSYIQEDEAGEITVLNALSLETGEVTQSVDLKPLGYYAALRDGQDVLVFLRGETASLVHIDPASGNSRQIAANIGRALYAAPDGNTAFYSVMTDDNNFDLHEYDAATGLTRRLFALPEGVQDYAAFNIAGTELTAFLAGSQTDIVFRLDHPESSQWVKVAEFSDAQFTNISRIVVNRTATRIALVAEKPIQP